MNNPNSNECLSELASQIETFQIDGGNDKVTKKDVYNENIPIFPLIRRPFFPGMAAPLLIEPGPYYEMLKHIVKSEHKYLGLLLTKSENVEINKLSFDQLYPIGVVARILHIIPMEHGGAQVILNIEQRFQIEAPFSHSPYLKAKVKYHKDTGDEGSEDFEELKAYALTIISTIKDLLKLNPIFKEELQIFLGHSDFTEPGKLADFAVTLTTASREELQDILATFDVKERLKKAIQLLKKEQDISKLQNNINKKIEAALTKNQKEFFLREQLKTIRKELGIEKEDKLTEKEKFESRLKNRQVPQDVLKVIREELDKFTALESHSPEYGTVRTYLDWLTLIPWGSYSEECPKLAKAKKILEDDHYALEDIKQRILEFISVGKLSGGMRGSIICLVGPPGVGKTSIGKSIARALNRKFYRFSVGGMRDVAEIKGHRRTYIGAMPGKLIQALKICQTMDPVIMLDEIDKMGVGFHGDPAAALLEVLDPEQNCAFLDHYLDVPCDLSRVLFIVTANVLDTIPEPLKDRMDIMRLSGYILQEKMEIASKYLVPRNLQAVGLLSSQVSFTKEALRHVIHSYAREAGVRNLENHIKKIMRKAAYVVVQEQEQLQISEKKKSIGKSKKNTEITEKSSQILSTPLKKRSIKVEDIQEYLGKPMYNNDRFYDRPPIGVCMGLAWTSLGGATLYIEAIKIPAKQTGMKLTGQAGQVMKESSEIAWSYIHSAINQLAPGYSFFEKAQIHMHIPEGATPKDGPSAGITMATSLVSLLLNEPVAENLSMTGELTLTGRVLPVGGIKEKLVAARRSGVHTLIFPKDIRRMEASALIKAPDERERSELQKPSNVLIF